MITQPQIQHDSIADIIYKSLFDDIVNGKLRPGQRITEREISESRGISRAPVREAITKLAKDGLVMLMPRRGCYVCELTERDINQVYDIRLRLETLALEYAFENLDFAQLQKLRNKFIACLEYDDHKMIREEIKLDSIFHDTIFAASQSTHLQRMLDNLLARVHVFRSVSSMDPGRARVAIKKHIAILDAIIKEDCTRASKLLEQHIERSRKNALENADFFKKQ